MRIRFFSRKQLVNKRVAGFHDIRLDGMSDLVMRAKGSRVLDVGSNRGMISLEFAANGAATIHGCDIYEPGILASREVFADIPAVESRFEIVDLANGPQALNQAFGSDFGNYDIIIFSAVDHKLQRIMPQEKVNELVAHLAANTRRFFAYRGRTADTYEPIMNAAGLKRIHYSEIAEHHFGAPAIIWERKQG